MSVARPAYGTSGEFTAGEKVILDRDVPLWNAIERHYAGDDPQKWKMLACLHLRVHCRWELEKIGLAYGHPRGHILRLIAQVKRELREVFAAEGQEPRVEGREPDDIDRAAG